MKPTAVLVLLLSPAIVRAQHARPAHESTSGARERNRVAHSETGSGGEHASRESTGGSLRDLASNHDTEMRTAIPSTEARDHQTELRGAEPGARPQASRREGMPWTGTKLETVANGGWLSREYKSPTGHKITLWAEVVREGDTIHLSELGVANDIRTAQNGANTGSQIQGFNTRVPVGMREMAPAVSQLSAEAAALGFKTLRITAHRITGAKVKNGKTDTALDIKRDLTKLGDTAAAGEH